MVPGWATEALDEEPELQLPEEQKEAIEAIAWLKAIREAGHSSDWRSGLQRIYRTFAAEGPAGIPKALIHILANAPHELGEMIRETADRAVPYSEPHCSPTQGGGAARPVAARHKELLPLPWSPEAGEALVPPTGRRNKPVYVQVYIREGEQQLAKLKHTQITGKLLEAEGGTSLVGDGRARLKAFRAL